MRINRIRDLREDHDLTQTQIAKLLNIEQTTYSKYERGKVNVPMDAYLKLADYYGVSLDYLLGRTDNPQVNR